MLCTGKCENHLKKEKIARKKYTEMRVTLNMHETGRTL